MTASAVRPQNRASSDLEVGDANAPRSRTRFPSIKAFKESLDRGGIEYVSFESPGTAHEWLTWRRSLNDFAPRLFK